MSAALPRMLPSRCVRARWPFFQGDCLRHGGRPSPLRKRRRLRLRLAIRYGIRSRRRSLKAAGADVLLQQIVGFVGGISPPHSR